MLEKKEEKNKNIDSVKYRLLIFLTGFLGLFVLSFIIEIIVYIVDPSYLDKNSTHYVDGLGIINTCRYSLALLLFIILLFPFLKDIFKKFKNYKNVLMGLALGILLIAVTIAYNNLIDAIVGKYEPIDNEILAREFIAKYPFLAVFTIGLIGPIIEELTYRFGLFELCKKKNLILAYIMSIFLFASIHFLSSNDIKVTLLNLPNYLIAGGILTFSYHKYSLEASLTAHILNNMFAIIVQIIGNK